MNSLHSKIIVTLTIIKHIKNERAARNEITKTSTDIPVLSVVAADMIHVMIIMKY